MIDLGRVNSPIGSVFITRPGVEWYVGTIPPKCANNSEGIVRGKCGILRIPRMRFAMLGWIFRKRNDAIIRN